MKTYSAMKLATNILLLFAAAVLAEDFEIDWSNLVSMGLKIPNMPLHRGLRMPGESRIVGGKEANPHQFPHQVGLFIHLEDGTGFCGGSLISDQWVLTAAHCADTAETFTVILGAHNIRETEATQIRLTVTEKIVHPEWNAQRIANDVALLKLPSKINLSDKISTVRLPSRSQVSETFEDVTSTVSGWGRDSDDATSITPILRWVENPVIQNFVCNVLFFGSINDGHICTSGTGGKGTCNGDSGGPLTILESDGQVTQVGIVSFGISFGCEIGWPLAFARVTYYLDWITATTGIPIRE